MATENSPVMNGDDRRQAAGGPSRRQGVHQFVWSVSSPSPAEIAELELMFPSVIQLPSDTIDREIKEWLAGGLIVRSLFRWVPPEAVVREFRRFGIAGGISSISLSHRFVLMKFEDPAARDAVLLQPWVVNGQPLSAEPWRPDFVPTTEALSTALLWIRLPNLPIEYWSEEALRSILAVAGEFVSLDSSTKGKRRGSFARAAVRVDLNRPLRPGARIRGIGTPFWQQFTYEHIDGVCPRCGSIHLGCLCSSSSPQSSASVPPRFGPWMTATRHRKPPAVAESGGPRSSLTSPPAYGKSSAPVPGDGWTTPRKVARRRHDPSSSACLAEALKPSLNEVDPPCQELFSVPVTVAKVSDTLAPGANVQKIPIKSTLNSQLAGQKEKDKVHCLTSDFKFSAKAPASTFQGPGQVKQSLPLDVETVRQKEGLMTEAGSRQGSSTKVATNPFSLRGSDRWAGVPKIREDANPTSTKRARPAELIPQRAIPKAVKPKGKGRVGPSQKAISGSSLPPRDSCDHDAAVFTLKQAILPSSHGSENMELSQQPFSPDLGTLSLPSDAVQEVVAVMSTEGGHTDMDMMGSQAGGQVIPHTDQ